MTAKRYFAHLLVFSLLTGVAVVGFNYRVDPYAITGASRVQGLNQYKADINGFTRLSKKYQPFLHSYDTLIVGNSRVEMGIDPAHSCFKDQNWDVYNIGLPGASVRKQLEYALNVMYQQPIERVFLSVDFTDFLSADPHFNPVASSLHIPLRGDLEYLSTGQPNPEFWKIKAVDFYRALFSLDSLLSSVKTIALQKEHSSDRDDAGFNPARDFSHSVRVEGAAALFDQKLRVLDNKYSKKWYLRNVDGLLDQSFGEITEFLAIAAMMDVEVIVFTNPFHETYWNMLKRNNLLDLHRDWTGSIEEKLSLDPETTPMALWDFSEDSVYIHESVPSQKVLNKYLDWFWEPAHYRKGLGDKMVETMLSRRCNSIADFGRRVF